MVYLIDGHNLIPKVPGLSLSSPDDEVRLIELLQDFSRNSRNTIEVYFDNAPVSQTEKRRFGSVIAHFVSKRSTADDAIRARLHRLGNSARNYTIVSSDRQVQVDARAAKSAVLSAEEFAHMLFPQPSTHEKDPGADPGAELSPDQLAEWLELFGKKKRSGDQQ